MVIRIQPLDIEVPKDDPFSNDSLERKEPANVLTPAIETPKARNPCLNFCQTPMPL